MAEHITPQNAKYTWGHIPRDDGGKRLPVERVNDFLDILHSLDAREARDQASRCLQCPDAPCVQGCPLHNCIPEWMALVAEGEMDRAAELITQSGSLAEIVSRLCGTECEAYCVLERTGSPVAINAIERFLSAHPQLRELATASPSSPAPGKGRVAVVGCSPASFACAFDLVCNSISVSLVVPEVSPENTPAWTIPGFKLDPILVRKRLDQLQSLGVELREGAEALDALSIPRLQSQFDAVFIGPFAELPTPIQMPGSTLAGVYLASDFLRIHNTSPPAKDLLGKHVAVLGGGDCALHCARMAMRRGAASTTCLYRRDRSHMPCSQEDVKAALEEGVQFMFHIQPIRILPGKDSGARGVVCLQTVPGPLDSTGRPAPQVVPGSEFEFSADILIGAFGVAGSDLSKCIGIQDLRFNDAGELVVDQDQMTSAPGIFAAGRIVHRRQHVPEAVRDSRKAARAIGCFLASTRPYSPGLLP